jgi:hypothetical protein
MAGMVLGSEEFARRLLRRVRSNAREQATVRKLRHRLKWAQIVAAVEQAKGRSWREFSEQHGDWGRDAALWLGRHRGGYHLGELGRLAGGLDYAAVGQAESRFGKESEKKAESAPATSPK